MGLLSRKKDEDGEVKTYEFNSGGSIMRIKTVYNKKYEDEEEVHTYLTDSLLGRSITTKGTVIPIEYHDKKIVIAEKIVVKSQSKIPSLDEIDLAYSFDNMFLEEGGKLEVQHMEDTLYFEVVSIFPPTELGVVKIRTVFDIINNSE